MYKYLEII